MQQEIQRNPYADHLAILNKTNPVIASENIYNDLGAIIVTEGTEIDESVSNKIARFSLRSPLELSVNLQNAITPKEFFSDIQKAPIVLLDKLDDLYVRYKQELIQQCGAYAYYPLLTQKITVLRERFPLVYNYTQNITGIALSIATNMELDEETINVIFITAQMHESGLLNLPPEKLVQVDEMNDSAKNKLFQKQLEAGSELLRNVPNLSKRVYKAVLEHKERRDGSGWPAGSVNSNQSVESQVVGIAAMLNEAYIKHLLPKGYGSQILYNALQMEGEGFDLNIYNGAAQLLMVNPHATKRFLPDEFIPPLTRYLSVLQKSLVHWFNLAKECAKDIAFERYEHEAIRSENIAEGLERTLCNSGLWDQELLKWLNEVACSDNSGDYREVEIIAVMFDLVLEKLKRLLWSMIDASKAINAEWLPRCEELFALLENIPDNHYLALERYDCL